MDNPANNSALSANGAQLQHILYVEDHLESQLLIQSFLKGRYIVSCASTTSEADDILEEQETVLILLDLSLEGNEDGLDMVRRLRSNPQYEVIPIIVITAHAYPLNRQNALEAGCDAYLTKPIRRAQLLEYISKYLSS